MPATMARPAPAHGTPDAHPTRTTPGTNARTTSPGGPIRCLIVDDHPAIRLGLQDLLAGEPELEIAAAVATAEEGLSVASRHPVQVAVVDYQLGGRSGLWLSRRLAALTDPPGVVIYSAHGSHLLAAGCIVAQAHAFVSKAALGESLVARVHEVAAGRARLPVVPPALAESIGRRLDPTEQAIFGMMTARVPPREVAETLRLTDAELDAALWRMLDALQRFPDAGPRP